MTITIDIDAWNTAHPIGTRVRYRSSPSAEPFEAATRSEAWLLSGHTPVVMLTGKSGCVALSHCEVVGARNG